MVLRLLCRIYGCHWPRPLARDVGSLLSALIPGKGAYKSIAFGRTFKSTPEPIRTCKVPDLTNIEIGSIVRHNSLQAAPPLGRKLEFDRNWLFVIKFQQSVRHVTPPADAGQAAVLANTPFGDEVPSSSFLEQQSKVDELEIVMVAAHGDDLERGQIIAALDDARLDEPKRIAAVTDTCGRQIAAFDEPLQPSMARLIANAEPGRGLLNGHEAVAVDPLEQACIAWCEIHEPPLRFVCPVSETVGRLILFIANLGLLNRNHYKRREPVSRA